MPLSKLEGEWILNLVPPVQRFGAFGFAASREAVLHSLREQRSDILHIAAHAIADSERPELSTIVLSLYDEDGRPRDSRLQLHDIYDIHGSGWDLIVLSACQTTIGKDFAGEGMMGLARGLLGIGTRAVVSSLYTVQEESTLELMKAFYDEMLGPRKLSPAAALRAAQLKLIARPRFSDPHLWSAFVVVGEPG